MLPTFPEFKKLSIEDKNHIEEYISEFPPYSDFNFTSLWSWGDEETYISTLDGNLVIKFRDYITSEPFYTFIGINKVKDTIKTLLEQSDKDGVQLRLKLIPEVALKADPDLLNHFDVLEDRDNFDYIYLIEEALTFQGKKHRGKRNFVNRFKKLYKTTSQIIDIREIVVQNEMVNLFETWMKLKSKDQSEVENELSAIKKLFKFAEHLDMLCIGIYHEGKLIGFSVNEVLKNGYAMNLFEKGDTAFQGIYPYLRHITAVYLHEKGCKYLSHEQDLGIEGLRQSKMSYGPNFFLKKYTIKRK